MKTVFFGSSDYCLPVLESLRRDWQLQLIVTRPDRPVGREQTLTASAVKLWAQKVGIAVITPKTLKLDTPERSQTAKLLTGLKPDIAIVADYGLIIPRGIFEIPGLGTFNIHFSRLPDLRGPSPVQSALLRGDTTAYITVFRLEKTLDTGPIVDQRGFPILPGDTAQSLYIRLFREAGKYLTGLNFRKPLSPQSGPPSFCQLLTRQDGFVTWEQLHTSIAGEAEQIYNRYRGMFPWPGLWTINEGKRMKILKCHPASGRLILDLVQFEGKTPQTWGESK